MVFFLSFLIMALTWNWIYNLVSYLRGDASRATKWMKKANPVAPGRREKKWSTGRQEKGFPSMYVLKATSGPMPIFILFKKGPSAIPCG